MTDSPATLYTSPAAIMRWLGIPALHNSDNLKPISPDRNITLLQLWWAEHTRPAEETPDDIA